jgi:hypothetical protein
MYAPPIDLVMAQRVGSDGAVLTSTRQPPRPIDLHILVEGVGTVLAAWSTLLRAFNAGGYFRHTGTTGVRVLRDVRLESASASGFGYNIDAAGADVATVSLLALDPWWYGEAVVVPLQITGDSIPWNSANDWSAALPWNGGATVSVVVTGDTPASPMIDVYGPATEVSVGLSAGTAWQTAPATTLTAGRRLTVDHRPGNRGPKLSGEANIRWTVLTEASRLFDMPQGTNTVVFNVSGDTSSTTATITYEPRWLTP